MGRSSQGGKRHFQKRKQHVQRHGGLERALGKGEKFDVTEIQSR